MCEKLDFEQNHCSTSAITIYKIAHDSIRLMKWICYYDKSYFENIKYSDLMASNLICFGNDI